LGVKLQLALDRTQVHPVAPCAEGVTMERVLVLGGHLDDSVIAVGGIIRKLVDSGVRVSVVCFGNGDEAFTERGGRERAQERFNAEAVAAHRVLGVEDFQCLDLPDFAVQENRATYRQCVKAIRRVRPDIILSHYWTEYFQHRAMARLACDAWWQAQWDCSADLGKPWSARALYHFEVIHDLPEPTHIVDISGEFEAKIKAWKQFMTAQDHLDKMTDQLEARARHHGSRIGVKYAEVLKRSYFVPEALR
jgi:LmbE family N-acetylglucosaminyl deacetylase